MNFTQLRYFVAVARNRNLSRAAAELHIAQPALSRQIRLLEEELGIQLFSRHHRGSELTDAGLLLLQRSDFLLRRLEEVKAEIIDFSAVPKGQLRIGCPPALTATMVGKTLQKFILKFPNVRLQLQETISDRLCQAVVADQLDCSIVSTQVSEPNLITVPLYSEPVWIFGPRSILKRAPRSIQEIVDIPLVLALPNNAPRGKLDRRVAEAGLSLRIVAETNSISLINELVQRGVGCTVGPKSSFRLLSKRSGMFGGQIEDLSIERSFIRRIDRPITVAMRAFINLLQEDFPNLMESLELTMQSDKIKLTRTKGRTNKKQKK